MKKILVPALALFALTPAAAHAQEQRFEHQGRVYAYTVTEVDGYRVISGVEEKTGKPFKLRVGTHRVRGTVGTQQVNFSLRDVEPLGEAAVTLAAR